MTQNLAWLLDVSAARAGAVLVTIGKIALKTVGADRNSSKNLFIN